MATTDPDRRLRGSFPLLGVGSVCLAWLSAVAAVAVSYSGKTKYFCDPSPHHGLRVVLVSLAIGGALMAIVVGGVDGLFGRRPGKVWWESVGIVVAGLLTLLGAPMLYFVGVELLRNHVGC